MYACSLHRRVLNVVYKFNTHALRGNCKTLTLLPLLENCYAYACACGYTRSGRSVSVIAATPEDPHTKHDNKVRSLDSHANAHGMHGPSRTFLRMREGMRTQHDLDRFDFVDVTSLPLDNTTKAKLKQTQNATTLPDPSAASDVETHMDNNNSIHQHKINADNIFEKYDFLRNPQPVENVIEMPFGTVRLDSANKLSRKQHKGVVKQSDTNASSIEQSNETAYIDEQYFASHNVTTQEMKNLPHFSDSEVAYEDMFIDDNVKCMTTFPVTHEDTTSVDESFGNEYIDDQYFSMSNGNTFDPLRHNNIIGMNDQMAEFQVSSVNKACAENADCDMSRNASVGEKKFVQHDKSCQPVQHALTEEIAEMPFLNNKETITEPKEEFQVTSAGNAYIDEQYFVPTKDSTSVSQLEMTKQLERQHDSNTVKKSCNSILHARTQSAYEVKEQELLTEISAKGLGDGPVTKQILRKKTAQKQRSDECQEEAFGVAMKMRSSYERSTHADSPEGEIKFRGSSKQKWDGKVDSHGFRILTKQVVDCEYLPEDIVVNILKDSIIYKDEDILAIDKPYGIPSHGGPGIHHNIGKLLLPLASRVGDDALHLVHRLDKETTGVMLLARSKEAEWKLLQMFRKRAVVKKYLVITKGVPNPTEGSIDIPMAEANIQGKYRMTLRPDYTEKTQILLQKARRVRKADAITNYRVLDSHHSAALVECQPESGLKHQIRCHLAYGLNTPILGDHKYSHFTRIAPQKLPADMLQRLGIRQAKVRHVPMHLHASLVVLPEFRDGKNVFISAALPSHFRQNLKWLRLKLPSKK